MKRKSWFTIGATVLVIGAYAVLFLEVSPAPSLADPGEGLCLASGVEIAWSDPADGFIDARQIEDADGNPQGITQIRVRFSESVDLTSECISIVTTGGNPPAVQEVTANGDDWTINLDRPIPAAESTAIVFDAGAAWVLIHSHPGDVNLDGTTDWNDAIALDAAIEAGWTEDTGYDVNRDGQVTSADADRLAGVIALYEGRLWYEQSLRQVLCCCVFDRCSVTVASSCESGGDCPCVPNPCEVLP